MNNFRRENKKTGEHMHQIYPYEIIQIEEKYKLTIFLRDDATPSIYFVSLLSSFINRFSYLHIFKLVINLTIYIFNNIEFT